MAENNRTMETASFETQYALVVKRDGVNKFVAKRYGWDFTVKLAKARKFNSPSEALKCYERENIARRGVEFVGVATIQRTLAVVDIPTSEGINSKIEHDAIYEECMKQVERTKADFDCICTECLVDIAEGNTLILVHLEDHDMRLCEECAGRLGWLGY